MRRAMIQRVSRRQLKIRNSQVTSSLLLATSSCFLPPPSLATNCSAIGASMKCPPARQQAHVVYNAAWPVVSFQLKPSDIDSSLDTSNDL
ncbi:hypothetical protein BYT27DRAFT_7203008 [Phlegmacium glaucopus]|nr:hypothetical protein BYT27DRAFT_7203008 [Phlegmacium glaucopus]